MNDSASFNDLEVITNNFKKIWDSEEQFNPAFYSQYNKFIAQVKLRTDELCAIFHLTEAHGSHLRNVSLFKNLVKKRHSKEAVLDEKYFSYKSEYTEMAYKGLEKRLEELPDEWTIVQLTENCNKNIYFAGRQENQSPPISYLHLTRLPCGLIFKEFIPVCEQINWFPNCSFDILDHFRKMKEILQYKTVKSVRQKCQDLYLKYCLDTTKILNETKSECFDWKIILMLGSLKDKKLECDIRNLVNNDLQMSDFTLTKRELYLIYLLAEYSHELNVIKIKEALYDILMDKDRAKFILTKISFIKERYSDDLKKAHRNPVLLIPDEFIFLFPWESIPELKEHPISRMMSIHFIHAIYKIHEAHIRNGLREVNISELRPYFICNPDKTILGMNDLENFMEKRLPKNSYKIIDRIPTTNEITEALSNSIIYCGHGSGSLYLKENLFVENSQLGPIHSLFGCGSASLKDFGGHCPFFGDILQYTLHGSGCTVGFLYTVLSGETDRLTKSIYNYWLPGPALNFENLSNDFTIQQYPELLRAISKARASAKTITHKISLIAIGIPILLT